MLRDSQLRWRNEKDETGLFKTFRDQKKTKRDRKRHFETLEKQESNTEHKKEKEKQKISRRQRRINQKNLQKHISIRSTRIMVFILVREWDFSKNLPVNIKPIT